MLIKRWAIVNDFMYKVDVPSKMTNFIDIYNVYLLSTPVL